MPVLYRYQHKDGSYIKAGIQGSVVTLQLTELGRGQLEAAGIGDGMRFPMQLLLELIREGHAYTRRDALCRASPNEIEQFRFDFDRELEVAGRLPRCEVTGTFDDLHLVVHGGDNHTQLLGPEARRYCEGMTLSVPITILSPAALDQLLGAGKAQPDAACFRVLREWFANGNRQVWEAFRSRRTSRQQTLHLPASDEFALLAVMEGEPPASGRRSGAPSRSG